MGPTLPLHPPIATTRNHGNHMLGPYYLHILPLLADWESISPGDSSVNKTVLRNDDVDWGAGGDRACAVDGKVLGSRQQLDNDPLAPCKR